MRIKSGRICEVFLAGAVLSALAAPAGPARARTEWRVMPVRSQEGYSLDMPGGEGVEVLQARDDPRIVRGELPVNDLALEEFAYVRVLTGDGEMAWSSPVWGDRK